MMTVALGAGVVGSISGTVAWFQYSTRSTVAFTGTSAHCTENLQIRLVKAGQGDDEGWQSDLTSAMVKAALQSVKGNYYASSTAAASPLSFDETNTGKFYNVYKHGGEFKFVYNSADSKWYLGDEIVDLTACGISVSSPAAGAYIEVVADAIDTVRPVTSGTLAEGAVASTLYRNPVYQYPHMSNWKVAKTSDFVTIPLELRVKDVNGKAGTTALAKNIYVSRMSMAVEPVAGKKDITSALRVAVTTYNDTTPENYGTFSTSGDPVTTYGKLDLNKDSANDKFGDFAWEKSPEIFYGYEHEDITISVITGNNVASAEVKDDWFVGAHGVEDGEFEFLYSDEEQSWTLNGANVDLAEYGISVTLKEGKTAPLGNDKLKVIVPEEVATRNIADSFNLERVSDSVTKGIANDDDPYAIVGTPIGKTAADKPLRVDLKIYLEGWQQLEGSALWDASTYIGSGFNVGVRFSADAHVDHE